MNDIITPTVGRVVHYYPNGSAIPCPIGFKDKPWKADIVAVHSDQRVNLSAFDPLGEHLAIANVILVQPGDDCPPRGIDYCTWMPYQVKKATGSESDVKGAGTEEI